MYHVRPSLISGTYESFNRIVCLNCNFVIFIIILILVWCYTLFNSDIMCFRTMGSFTIDLLQTKDKKGQRCETDIKYMLLQLRVQKCVMFNSNYVKLMACGGSVSDTCSYVCPSLCRRRTWVFASSTSPAYSCSVAAPSSSGKKGREFTYDISWQPETSSLNLT